MNVSPVFQPHYISPENNSHGAKGLIVKILKESGCELIDGTENENRGLAISKSLFVADLIDLARDHFGDETSRYSTQSLRVFVSTVLSKKGIVKTFQLSNNEDHLRDKTKCFKPRVKVYLVAGNS